MNGKKNMTKMIGGGLLAIASLGAYVFAAGKAYDIDDKRENLKNGFESGEIARESYQEQLNKTVVEEWAFISMTVLGILSAAVGCYYSVEGFANEFCF